MSIKAEYMVKVGRACSENNRPDMPIFAIFSQMYKNKQMFLWSYYTDHHHICTLCSHIQCVSKLSIVIPIFQSASEWQHDKENFSTKKADLPTFVGCHGNVPWAIAKWMQNLSSPYITLPIPEKLLKIRPVVPQNSLLQGRPRPLTKYKIIKENISKIYNPVGKFAEWAK